MVVAASSSASPLLLPSGPRHASMAWLRGGSAFRSRALSAEAPPCCCRATGWSAAQCGAPDDFVIRIGSSGTKRSLLGVAAGASAFGLAAFDALASGLPPQIFDRFSISVGSQSIGRRGRAELISCAQEQEKESSFFDASSIFRVSVSCAQEQEYIRRQADVTPDYKAL